MNWLDILELVIPSLVGIVSVVVHFFVFHRLKCDKQILDCMKRDFLPAVKSIFSNAVETPAESQSSHSTVSLETVLQSFKNMSLDEQYALIIDVFFDILKQKDSIQNSEVKHNGNDN